MTAASSPVALRAIGVAKRFGEVRANRDATLTVQRGEIHALVGENGAGKSTLMRILAGMYPPDGGRVEVNGKDVTGWSTREAIAAGVGMVHQHFMLVPTLTVAENLVLGQELTKGMQLDRAGAERAVRELCERTGLRVDPSRLVSDLSVGELQRVEILKVLYRGAKILILDEPTAVLSPPEVTELWRVLRKLTAEGGTVVLITHKLDEVMEASSSITVMRAGATVGEVQTSATTPAGIAKMMVGRDVRLASVREDERTRRREDEGTTLGGRGVGGGSAAPSRSRPTPVLSVSRLTVASSRKPNEVDDLSFDVLPGEIFGIAGVEGNGQTELIEAIAGLRSPASGTISMAGKPVTELSVRARAELGLSHIPEDRHRRGLVLDYSIGDNLILGLQHHFAGSGGVLRGEQVHSNALARIREFDIRPPNAELPARSLSGGNQQKIVIAREMRGREYTVLLASQPTRGVDVGAIEFIHEQLRAARNAGKGVLLISADLVEVLSLADRVAVMYEGRIVATLARDEATRELVGEYMTGATGGTGDGGRETGVAPAAPEGQRPNDEDVR
ncbi:MAG: ABC transporter ATP-binding protein [Gemmatimonadaceae bacterium]|nr:ABC transporter ATP-binding protein [Gemmatimonadaceae bacterium]